MTVLQVADLRFGYAGDTLFENVTFTLALGERAALVAPNGAGKSTLLRLIAGELEPDQGSSVVRARGDARLLPAVARAAAEGDVLGRVPVRLPRGRGAPRGSCTQAQHDAAASGDAEGARPPRRT